MAVALRSSSNLPCPRRFVVAKVPEVVLHRIGPHIEHRRGETGEGEPHAYGRDSPGGHRDDTREGPAERDTASGERAQPGDEPANPGRHRALAGRQADRRHALDDGEDGRQRGVRRDPAEEHPEAADHPEVPETAELGDHQRAVRSRGRARRRQRRPPRLAVRDADAVQERGAAPARLQEARHVDDAEVATVADEDREQEPRRHVEVADQDLGEAVGPRDSNADAQQHRDEGAEAQVEKEYDAGNEHGAQVADLGQILVHGRVLGDAGLEVARVPDGDPWPERRDVHSIDGLVHAPDRLQSVLEVSVEDLRADGDDDRLAVLRLVVAVGVASCRVAPEAQARLDGLDVERRRGRALVEQEPAALAHLVLVAGLNVVAQLRELARVGEEPGPRREELVRLLHAVLHAPDPRRAHLLDRRDERVRSAAQRGGRRRVRAFEHDEERGDPRRPPGHAVELDDARPVSGQQRLEARLHGQTERQRERDGGHEAGRDQPHGRAIDLRFGQLVGKRRRALRSRRRHLRARGGRPLGRRLCAHRLPTSARTDRPLIGARGLHATCQRQDERDEAPLRRVRPAYCTMAPGPPSCPGQGPSSRACLTTCSAPTARASCNLHDPTDSSCFTRLGTSRCR